MADIGRRCHGHHRQLSRQTYQDCCSTTATHQQIDTVLNNKTGRTGASASLMRTLFTLQDRSCRMKMRSILLTQMSSSPPEFMIGFPHFSYRLIPITLLHKLYTAIYVVGCIVCCFYLHTFSDEEKSIWPPINMYAGINQKWSISSML